MQRYRQAMFDSIFPGSETVEVVHQSEVAEVVAAAYAEQRPIHPVGGATSLGLGAVAGKPGTVLRLARLNQRVDYPSRDLTITVEAGMTMAELAKCLRAEQQRLPVDVANAQSATVGGVVAGNLCGPRRYRYGTVRDYLLGLTVVDGTGRSFCTGGRVVKNAAGYDLTRLMIGSLGALGVITQATLMVRPMPEMSAFVVVPLTSLEKAEPLLVSLRTSALEPASLSVVVGDHLDKSPDPDAAATLWIGIESSEIEVRWMLDLASRLCREQGLAPVFMDAPDRVASIWRGLTEHAAVRPDQRATAFAVELTILPSRTVAAAVRLHQFDPEASLHCQAGNGVILARFSCKPENAGELVTRIRSAAEELGGRVVVTDFPPESRLDRSAIWGPPGPEIRVMQRIKRQFDPEGILNPGRFVFE